MTMTLSQTIVLFVAISISALVYMAIWTWVNRRRLF